MDARANWTSAPSCRSARAATTCPRCSTSTPRAWPQAGVSFEIIVVLDGPLAGAGGAARRAAAAQALAAGDRAARDFGEAAALTAGFDAARGRKILTLPAYYQVVRRSCRKLIAAGETDMAVAVRWPRAGSGLRGLAAQRLPRAAGGDHRPALSRPGLRRAAAEAGDRRGDPAVRRAAPLLPDAGVSRGFEVREVEVAQSPQG
jgi:hypothetical protein